MLNLRMHMGLRKIAFIGLLLFNGVAFGQDEPINQTDSKGRKQGKWIKNHDKSEVPRYIGQFKDDKPYGEFRYYYESGHIKSQMFFSKDGKSSRATIFYEDGKKMSYGRYSNQKKDSVWTHYDVAGWVSMRETYTIDKLNGKVTVYYAPAKGKADAVAQEFNYKAGLKHGEWKRFFESGTTMVSGTYKDGVLDGIVTYFTVDGKREVTETYWKGRLHGPRIQFENNVETSRTYYQDDKKLEGKDLEEFLRKEKEAKDKYYQNQKGGNQKKTTNGTTNGTKKGN
ncbi:MAG: toxin-antitoxin system YwqK family antitoxin [Flavobacteriales bacterium]